MSDNKRKYLVYKVTNRFDGKIYIGCHSTLNNDDRYMGSGTELKEAIKNEGRKSFVKEILFEFDNKEEMLSKEKELVTKEFCMREDTYNRIEGGGVYSTLGMVTVKDKEGNTSKVYCDDPRWLSGELISIVKNTITVKDKEGNNLRVDKNDPRYLSGELIPNAKGFFHAKDREGNKFWITKKDTRWIAGELKGLLSGQPATLGFGGKTCSVEHKKKIGEANSLKQKGEGNSQYGTCWITRQGENKKIKKEDFDVYLLQGWIKGRK